MQGFNRNHTPTDNDSSPFAVADFDKYSKKPLSRRAKRIIAVVSLFSVVGICIALSIVFNLKGFLIRHFGSDMDYFEYVYDKGTKELTEDFSDLYGMALSALEKGQCASSGTVELEIGRDLNSLITLASKFIDVDEELSLDGLEKTSVAYTADVNDSGALLDAKLLISGERVATLEARRAVGGSTLVRIPEMGNTWLELSEPSEMKLAETLVFGGGQLAAALPDKKTAERLALKYLEELLACVDEVRGEKLELSCDSVSEKATRLVVELNEDKLRALVEKLFDDPEIVEIGRRTYTALKKSESGFDEAWVKLEELLCKAVEEIRGADADVALYVNSKHEFCGIKLNLLGHEFSVITLRQAKTTSHSIILTSESEGELFEISGVGEDTGKFNADYRLKLWGKNALRIKLQDANPDLSGGKIKISPDSSLVEAFGFEGLSRLVGSLFKALSFEGSYSIEAKKASFDLDVRNSGTKFFSLRINSQDKESERVSLPDSALITSDVKAWRRSLSDEGIMATLSSLGLSEGVLGIAQGFIDSIGKY